jgi:hypothetical protein
MKGFAAQKSVLCIVQGTGPPNIQGIPGGKVNILGDHSIGHSKKKMSM